jgi:hypothetical protein
MSDSYNPRITQGETWSLAVTVTGVNLSGYTARSKARLDFDSTATVWDTTAGSPVGTVAITSGANSTITLSLTAAETAALTPWTVGVFDIEYVSGGGAVTNILRGVFSVYPEVTYA